MSRFPVAFRRAGIRFLGILFPPGARLSLRSAHRTAASTASDLDGVSTFHMHETRPGWAPPVPRDQRCSRDRQEIPGRRLPFFHGQALYLGSHPIARGSR